MEDKQNKSRNYSNHFVLLFILLLVLFVADIILGPVKISLVSIIDVFLGTGNQVEESIIMNIRLPKAITALLVGAGLSVCGLQMQTLFRNALAGPFVLGISSGASLGVALVMLLASGSFLVTGLSGKLAFVVAASVGASIVLMLVLALSRNMSNTVMVLIIGLMISHIAGAFEGVLQYMSSAENLQVFIIWGLGNFSNVIWDDLLFMTPIVILGIITAITLSKPLNTLLLGENYALSIGTDFKKARKFIIISTAIMAGGITAFCGPIAFLGIAVPHLAKGIFKTFDHKVLIPATFLVGASLAVLCDILTQLIVDGSVLPINAVTSLIGAPVVIWVIWKQNKFK